MLDFSELSPETQRIVFGSTVLLAVCFGFALAMLVCMKTDILGRSLSYTTVQTSLGRHDFMPMYVLFFITIVITCAILYVTKSYILDDDLDKKKQGVKISIGISWVLFVASVVLISAGLRSALISIDSKYYFVASILTFYFSTIVMEIVLMNRMNDIPASLDKLDRSTTFNLQMGLAMLVVTYGIGAVVFL